jgi:hypothetical protein
LLQGEEMKLANVQDGFKLWVNSGGIPERLPDDCILFEDNGLE